MHIDRFRVAALAAMLISATAVFPARAASTAPAAAPAVTFTHEIMVDPNKLAGEPDVAIADGDRQMYVSAPWGFTTSVSLAWKSEDGGAQWDLLHGSCPANPLRPFCSRGGGDTEIQLGSPASPGRPQTVHFVDLNGLDTLTCARSVDGGKSFVVTGPAVAGHVCNVAAKNPPGSDRQWVAVWPAQYNNNPNHVDNLYMVYDTGETPPGGDDALRSLDGGNSWESACPAPGGTSCVGGPGKQGARPGPLLINKITGTLYEFMGTTGGAMVNISCDGGSSWTSKTIASNLPTSSSIGTTNDFVTGAIDTAGNLYSVWTVDNNGDAARPWQVYYSHSTDSTGSAGVGNCAAPIVGATWSAPTLLNGPGGVTAPKVNFGVMPWIAAGDPGRVDVAYYGSDQGLPFAPDATDPTPGHEWYLHFSQSLNALSAAPAFNDYVASETPMHTHSICFGGIGCTGSGDRNLSDFFELRPDSQGRAVILYVDDNNSQQAVPQAAFPGGPVVASVQQASGPGLYANVNGGFVTGPTESLSQSVGLRSGITDPAGDALLPAHQPAPGGNVDAADITNLQVSAKDAHTLAFTFTVKNMNGDPTTAIVNNAATAAAGEVHTTASWLATWHYKNDVWFASASVDKSGRQAFLAGRPLDVTASGAPKALEYALDPQGTANKAVTGNFNPSTNTVEVDVPVTAIGSPAATEVLSGLTGFTVNAQAPASVPGLDGPVVLLDGIDQTAPMSYAVDTTGGTIPEVPATALLVVAGVLGIGLVGLLGRRRRRQDS